MRLRILLAGITLALTAAMGVADDYVLTVDAEGAGLKTGGSFIVYDSAGKLKPGDRITRVFFGGSSWGSDICKVAPGSGSGEKLTQPGAAEGFAGEIQLGTGTPPDKAFSAVLAPARLGNPGENVRTLAVGASSAKLSIPWAAVFIAIGLIFLAFIGFKIMTSRTGGETPIVGGGSLERELKAVKEMVGRMFSAQEKGGGAERGSRELAEKLAAIEKKLDERPTPVPVEGGAVAMDIEPLRAMLAEIAARAERTDAAIESIRDAAARPQLPALPEGSDGTNVAAELALGISSSISALDARVSQLSEQISGISPTAGGSASAQAFDSEALRAALQSISESQSGQISEALAALGAKIEAVAERLGAIEASAVASAGRGADPEALRAALQSIADSQNGRTSEAFTLIASKIESVGDRLGTLEASALAGQTSTGGSSPEAIEELKNLLSGASERQSATFAQALSAFEEKFGLMFERLGALEGALKSAQEALAGASGSDSESLQQELSRFAESQQALSSIPGALQGLSQELATLAAKTERTEAAVDCLSKIAVSGDANREATPEEAARWEQLLTMEAKLSGVPDAVAMLREKMGQLETIFVGTAQRVEAFESHVMEIRSELGSGSAAISEKLNQLSAGNEAVEKVQGLIDSLAHEFVTFATKIEGIDSFMDGVREHLQALETGTAGQTESTANQLQELKAAISQSGELRMIVESAVTTMSQTSGKIDALAMGLSAVEAKMGNLDSGAVRSEAQPDPRIDQLLGGLQTTQQLGESFNYMRESVNVLSARSEALEAQIAELRTKLDNPPSSPAESQAPDARLDEILSLQNKNAALPEAIAALVEAVGSLATRAENLEAGFAEVRSGMELGAQSEPRTPDSRIDGLVEAAQAWSAIPDSMAALAARIESMEGAISATLQEVSEVKTGLSQSAPAGGSTEASDAAWRDLAASQQSLLGLPDALQAVQASLVEIRDRSEHTDAELREMRTALSSVPAGEGGPSFDPSQLESILARMNEIGAAAPSGDVSEKMDTLSQSIQANSTRWEEFEFRVNWLGERIEALHGALSEVRPASSVSSDSPAPARRATDPQVSPARGPRPKDIPVPSSSADKSLLIQKMLEDDVAEPKPPPAAKTEPEPAPVAEANEVGEGWDGDATVGEGKRPTPWNWLAVGGSADRHWSAETRQPITLSQTGEAPKALTPTEVPEPTSPMGQVLFALGHVIYAHGDKVLGFWPGNEPKAVSLGGALPDEEWRMLAHNGHLYCAHEDRVEVVELGTWSRTSGFKGNYYDQLYAGQHWVGVISDNDQAALEFRSGKNDAVEGTVRIKAQAEEVRATASIGDDVFLVTDSCKLFRCNPTAGKQIGQFADSGFEFLHLAAVDGNVLGMIQEGGAVAVRLLDPSGKKIRETRIPAASPISNPVIMGELMYVVDDEKHEVYVLHLTTMEEVDRVPLPGIAHVRRLSGMHDGRKRVLLIAGVDAQGQSGKAMLFDPETAYESQVCSVGAQCKVNFIPAEGKVVVTTSNTYQNIIRAFDPFAADSEAKKAA